MPGQAETNQLVIRSFLFVALRCIRAHAQLGIRARKLRAAMHLFPVFYITCYNINEQ
jgi:hypothetical protein